MTAVTMASQTTRLHLFLLLLPMVLVGHGVTVATAMEQSGGDNAYHHQDAASSDHRRLRRQSRYNDEKLMARELSRLYNTPKSSKSKRGSNGMSSSKGMSAASSTGVSRKGMSTSSSIKDSSSKGMMPTASSSSSSSMGMSNKGKSRAKSPSNLSTFLPTRPTIDPTTAPTWYPTPCIPANVTIDPMLFDSEEPRIVDGDAIGKVMESSDGLPYKFVLNEIVVQILSNDTGVVNRLLEKYNGTITSDGIFTGIPDDNATYANLSNPEYYATFPDEVLDAGFVVIKVDLTLSSLCDFEDYFSTDLYTFSSEDAARLFVLVERERSNGVSLDTIDESQQIDFGNEEIWWLASSGIGTNVIAAWSFLNYVGLPKTVALFGIRMLPFIDSIVKIGIIDDGFAFNESTGDVFDGVSGRFSPYGDPWQFDVVGNDMFAGGARDFLSPDKKWHGHGVYTTCCAEGEFGNGPAGSSGGTLRGSFSVPYFCRSNGKLGDLRACIYMLVNMRVDVIVYSWGGTCSKTCQDGGDNPLVQEALAYAESQNVIFVTSAGNEQRNMDTKGFQPCVYNSTICVGAVNKEGGPQPYSNWGRDVDIWAPAGYTSGLSPDTGVPFEFGGTSQAAPFIAGVIAMMKRVEPGINKTRALEILQATAMYPSTTDDPGNKVSTGFVDALAALRKLAPTADPTISISGTILPTGRGSVLLSADFNGPGLVARDFGTPQLLSTQLEITFSSDLDGELCTGITWVTVGRFACGEISLTTLGTTHEITATVSDQFGGTDTKKLMVDIINDVGGGSPATLITQGPSFVRVDINLFGILPFIDFYVAGPIILRGRAIDHENAEVPENRLRWFSDLDGFLGSGNQINIFPRRLSVKFTGNLDSNGCRELKPHKISLEANYSNGNVGRDEFLIRLDNSRYFCLE